MLNASSYPKHSINDSQLEQLWCYILKFCGDFLSDHTMASQFVPMAWKNLLVWKMSNNGNIIFHIVILLYACTQYLCMPHHSTTFIYMHMYICGPMKINHVSTKKLLTFSSLHYHNLWTICTNKIKFLPLLQNLMGFLLNFTEMGYHIQSWRY